MNRRTARILITVTMTMYILLITSCTAQYDTSNSDLDDLQSYAIRKRAYDRNVLRLLYRNIDRVRRDHQHMSDAGYGSRVSAGSKVANALIAHHVYGAFGPGRRKRFSMTDQLPF